MAGESEDSKQRYVSAVKVQRDIVEEAKKEYAKKYAILLRKQGKPEQVGTGIKCVCKKEIIQEFFVAIRAQRNPESFIALTSNPEYYWQEGHCFCPRCGIVYCKKILEKRKRQKLGKPAEISFKKEPGASVKE